MKKQLCIILAVVFMFACTACAPENPHAIISEEEAIRFAQHSRSVLDMIANQYDLSFYNDPDWGACSAEDSGHDYQVILSGTISGYSSQYRSDFFQETFSVVVRVSYKGCVSV